MYRAGAVAGEARCAGAVAWQVDSHSTWRKLQPMSQSIDTTSHARLIERDVIQAEVGNAGGCGLHN